MANWRDLAERARADKADAFPAPQLATPELSQVRQTGSSTANCGETGLAGTVTPAPLAGPFAREVTRLQVLPPPRKLSNPAVWPEIVADAERLIRSGWAERALALGWSDHDLFGISPTSTDEFESLAVWLAGRTVVAKTEWQARTSCDGIFYRDAFMRPNSPKGVVVFLWQFGRAA